MLVQPTPGRAVLDIQVINDDGSTSPLLLANEVKLDTASLAAAVNGWKQWVIGLVAASQAVYQSKVVPLGLSKGRVIKLRTGIDTGARTLWQPYETHKVLLLAAHYESSTGSAGYPFELTTVDALFDFSAGRKIAAYRGSIAGIVTEIAASHLLDVVVEPTVATVYNLVQSFDSDLDFIAERLVPAAVNTSGLSGYYFYVSGNALHFHTRNYQRLPQRVSYNLDRMSSATNLAVVDDSHGRSKDGGGGAYAVLYNPLTGATRTVGSDPAKYARFAQRLSQAGGGSIVGRHVGQNQDSIEQARIQMLYAYNRDRYARVTFILTNVLTAAVGEVVDLQLTSAADAASGPYFVEMIQLTLSGGAFQTVVTAIRGEVTGNRSNVNVAQAAGAMNTLAQPFEAPGVDASFATVAQSGSSVAVLPGGS